MADISKIAIDGDEYDIKDAEARKELKDRPEWTKSPEKPTYTAAEVGADAAGAAEGAVSAHDSSATAHRDIRALIPEWARAPEKPTYTAAEVGADAAGAAEGAVSAHNESETAHRDIREAIPTVPATLPNPNKLTFTGAVEAEYDGSAPVSVNIPAGGGGTDMSLGISGASTGQIAKISTVDAEGKPTAWAPVAMPSGGGDVWELIGSAEVTEEVAAIQFSEDLNGEPLALKAVAIYAPLGVIASQKGQLWVCLTAGSSYMELTGGNNDLSATQAKSFWIELALFGEYWRRLYEASTYDVGGVSGVVTGLTVRQSSGEPVSVVKIAPQYGTFTAGKFYVYGVRA